MRVLRNFALSAALVAGLTAPLASPAHADDDGPGLAIAAGLLGVTVGALAAGAVSGPVVYGPAYPAPRYAYPPPPPPPPVVYGRPVYAVPGPFYVARPWWGDDDDDR